MLVQLKNPKEIKPFLDDSVGVDLLSNREIALKSIRLEKTVGVYFLLHDSEVVYVGQSIDVESRIRSHRAEKEFDSYHVIACQQSELDALESAYIFYLQPKLNSRSNTSIRAPITIYGMLERSDKYKEYRTAVYGAHSRHQIPKIDWVHYLEAKLGMKIEVECSLPPPRPMCWGWPKKIRTVYFEKTGSYIRQCQGELLADFHNRFCMLINHLLNGSVSKESFKDSAYQFLKPRG